MSDKEKAAEILVGVTDVLLADSNKIGALYSGLMADRNRTVAMYAGQAQLRMAEAAGLLMALAKMLRDAEVVDGEKPDGEP